MFGLFKKKPTESDATAYCKTVASKAVIEPVLTGGLYSSFLIRINETGSTLAPYFQYELARDAFAAGIDDRIDQNDFEQVMTNFAELGMPPLRDDGRVSAVRVVLGQHNAPLMRWNG